MIAKKIEFVGAREPQGLRDQVAGALDALVDTRNVKPTSAHALFTDENGPKGGRAVRCALEVRLPRRAAVHVEALATTARLAFDEALVKLERQVRRLKESVRASKRRPKKYFVAKRGLAP